VKINEQTIRQACSELADILIAKNKDYGDSVEKQFNKYGLTSCLIRLDDKMSRLDNLKDQTHTNVKETLKDTSTDLSGYAVLLTILLSSESKHDMNFNPVPPYFGPDDQH
jgi:hypothetical protein